MKQSIFLISFFVSVFCFEETTAQNQVIMVDPNEAYQVLNDTIVQIVDVRTPNEFFEGHIKKAINIDFLASTFSNKINKLDKLKPVLIYCRSGKRSSESVDEFLKTGFAKIYNLEGGIIKWKADSLPLVTD